MARGKPLNLDTRDFATKSEATAYFGEMLNRYKPGDRVNHLNSCDLAALLKHHNEYEEKIGVGVLRFEVAVAQGYTTQCFKIVRVDGSSVEFSYVHCISH